MQNIRKILNFSQNSLDRLAEKTNVMNNNFLTAIDESVYSSQNQFYLQSGLEIGNKNNRRRQFEETQNQENQFLPNSQKVKVDEMQKQREKINSQLNQLKQEEFQIKEKSNSLNIFEKRQRIYNNEEAKRRAQEFVKFLKQDKRYREHKNKIQQQKSRLKFKIDEEEQKRLEEEEIERQKSRKRQQILQRMEQEENRKFQRKIIQIESNNLLAKLKKEEKIEKQVLNGPSRLIDYQNKKNMLQKRKRLSIEEIQFHEKQYSKLKKEREDEREQKNSIVRPQKTYRYPKNVWARRIEKQERNRRLEIFKQQERRKSVTQRKMEYQKLVKSNLPGIKDSYSPDNEEERGKMEKESFLRKQTSERLKKLQKKRKELMNPKQKIHRYENYLGRIKLKKPKKQESIKQSFKQESEMTSEVYIDLGQNWEDIVRNNSMTSDLKYSILKKKAQNLDVKAKQVEEEHQQGADETVELYLDSIKTKLALLTKI